MPRDRLYSIGAGSIAEFEGLFLFSDALQRLG